MPLGDGRVDVQLLGFLGEERIGCELSTCDVIVLPYSSLRRKAALASTSASLWDARASGVPVIASAVRGLSEHIRHEADGLLVPPDDPVALAGAVDRLRRDRDLLARLREGADELRNGMDPSHSGTVAMRAYARTLSCAPQSGGASE
jgi:glycosyltransferase involved in cell wall biosynthesis